jgi:putative membrane protein
MLVVGWTFALVAAAIHIVVFVWESLLFPRRVVHQRIFAIPTEDVPAVRLWAFCVGFYNLSLSAGMIYGVVAWVTGAGTVGRTLVTYLCLFMIFGGIVLVIADRVGFSRRRGSQTGGALAGVRASPARADRLRPLTGAGPQQGPRRRIRAAPAAGSGQFVALQHLGHEGGDRAALRAGEGDVREQRVTLERLDDARDPVVAAHP